MAANPLNCGDQLTCMIQDVKKSLRYTSIMNSFSEPKARFRLGAVVVDFDVELLIKLADLRKSHSIHLHRFIYIKQQRCKINILGPVIS